MPSAAPARTHQRVQWADLAKGVCILLVVLHHVTSKHYLGLVPADLGWLGQAWLGVNEALKPVRMPLFFLISGLFAANALHRPWRDVARRMTGPYYTYVVWLLVLAVVFSVERTLAMNRTQDARELLLDLVWASTGLWFLYALAVYFTVSKLLVRVPAGWVLTGTAVLSGAASWLPVDEVNRWSVLVHLVHFVAGSRFPDLVRALGAARAPGLLPALTLALAGASLAAHAAGAPRSVDLLLLSLVGVPWGVRCAVALSRMRRTSGVLSWLGRRTLPVYVLHMPVLALVHHAPVELLGGEGPGAPLLVLGYPALVTGAVVVACLGLHTGLVRAGLGFLFTLPQPPARRPEVRPVPALTEREPAQA